MTWVYVICASIVLLGSCGYLFGCSVVHWCRVHRAKQRLRTAIRALMYQ